MHGLGLDGHVGVPQHFAPLIMPIVANENACQKKFFHSFCPQAVATDAFGALSRFIHP